MGTIRKKILDHTFGCWKPLARLFLGTAMGSHGANCPTCLIHRQTHSSWEGAYYFWRVGEPRSCWGKATQPEMGQAVLSPKVKVSLRSGDAGGTGRGWGGARRPLVPGLCPKHTHTHTPLKVKPNKRTHSVNKHLKLPRVFEGLSCVPWWGAWGKRTKKQFWRKLMLWQVTHTKR